ncbi:MAG: SAM-dependent methyltransferase [Bacteroidales bacterium]|nr:SAM-dependent methyltransferase [Bacteroidales bacterium]
MKEECLICKAPLEYIKEDMLMECSICHKKEMSKTRCVNGHYVCNECHTKGIDEIIGLCLTEESRDPIEIIRKMMGMQFCHTHGPEHHIMVGCALLTAYRNAGGAIDLPAALKEMISRGGKVPGGACGFWGACGAAVSTGMFISIITGSTPLATEAWGHSNIMTSRSLAKLGEIGGPRCCKRNSYISILTAIEYAEEITGIKMKKSDVICSHTAFNSQCIGKRCPFHPSNA